jgi:hypothetical protein
MCDPHFTTSDPSVTWLPIEAYFIIAIPMLQQIIMTVCTAVLFTDMAEKSG